MNAPQRALTFLASAVLLASSACMAAAQQPAPIAIDVTPAGPIRPGELVTISARTNRTGGTCAVSVVVPTGAPLERTAVIAEDGACSAVFQVPWDAQPGTARADVALQPPGDAAPASSQFPIIADPELGVPLAIEVVPPDPAEPGREARLTIITNKTRGACGIETLFPGEAPRARDFEVGADIAPNGRCELRFTVPEDVQPGRALVGLLVIAPIGQVREWEGFLEIRPSDGAPTPEE